MTLMAPRALVLGLALVLAFGPGCATAGSGGGGLELGLKRGAGWSTLTVRLPQIVGPNAMLEMRGGRLVGIFQGRPLTVAITPDGLSGEVAGGGPARDPGTIEVDLTGG